MCLGEANLHFIHEIIAGGFFALIYNFRIGKILAGSTLFPLLSSYRILETPRKRQCEISFYPGIFFQQIPGAVLKNS